MKKLTNYIQLEDCIDGNLYIIDARNSNIGIFKKETGGFLISRTKFSSNFIFEEYHWDIYKINPELECFGDSPGTCGRCYYQALQKSNEFNSRFKKSYDTLKLFASISRKKK